MINSPLMKYMMRRVAWIYWFLLAFTLIGLVGVLGQAFYDTTLILNLEKHPFFPMGLFLALIWGMGVTTREFKQGSMLGFIMSRPVTRREFYNTVLLSGGIPLMILMFLPILYVLVLYPWFSLSLSLLNMFIICIIATAWVMVILLLGLNVGLLAGAYSTRRYGKAVSAFVIAALVAAFINLSNIVNTGLLGNPVVQAQSHPSLSLTAAILSIAALYYLGRWRVEKMDI